MVAAPVVVLSLPAIFDLVRRSSVKSDSNFVAADEGKNCSPSGDEFTGFVMPECPPPG